MYLLKDREDHVTTYVLPDMYYSCAKKRKVSVSFSDSLPTLLHPTKSWDRLRWSGAVVCPYLRVTVGPILFTNSSDVHERPCAGRLNPRRLPEKPSDSVLVISTLCKKKKGSSLILMVTVFRSYDPLISQKNSISKFWHRKTEILQAVWTDIQTKSLADSSACPFVPNSSGSSGVKNNLRKPFPSPPL